MQFTYALHTFVRELGNECHGSIRKWVEVSVCTLSHLSCDASGVSVILCVSPISFSFSLLCCCFSNSRGHERTNNSYGTDTDGTRKLLKQPRAPVLREMHPNSIAENECWSFFCLDASTLKASFPSALIETLWMSTSKLGFAHWACSCRHRAMFRHVRISKIGSSFLNLAKCPANQCLQERYKVTGSVLKNLARSCPRR